MKKSALAAILLAGSMPFLAACGGGTDDTAATAPDGVPGLSVTNAHMVLNAVSGNPAAVYFDLAYDGERPISLARASVEGAAVAEMHEYSEWEGAMQMMEMGPLTLEPGETYAFEPGGNHVMAMQPSETLQAGGTTEVTLIVAGGDKLSFPVEIRGAGEDRCNAA